MRVRPLSVASNELREALTWYRRRSPRAAENLWLRIQDARRSIVMFPHAAPSIGKRARRFILSGFPYDLIYAVLPDEIVIVAFAHHSRRPGYWKDRLRDIRIGLAKGEFDAPGDIDAHNAEVAARFNGPS